MLRPLTDTKRRTSPLRVPVGYGTTTFALTDVTSEPFARWANRGTRKGALAVLRGNDHGVEPAMSMYGISVYE